MVQNKPSLHPRSWDITESESEAGTTEEATEALVAVEVMKELEVCNKVMGEMDDVAERGIVVIRSFCSNACYLYL